MSDKLFISGQRVQVIATYCNAAQYTSPQILTLIPLLHYRQQLGESTS